METDPKILELADALMKAFSEYNLVVYQSNIPEVNLKISKAPLGNAQKSLTRKLYSWKAWFWPFR
jgi:hypothetical protein